MNQQIRTKEQTVSLLFLALSVLWCLHGYCLPNLIVSKAQPSQAQHRNSCKDMEVKHPRENMAQYGLKQDTA